ncbi:DEAD/DEAH box helicase [Priestia megaterium]
MKRNSESLIQELKEEYVGKVLPPSIAKLYSQYTKVKLNQPGLKGWQEDEFSKRLNDAVNLIDAGLYERESDGDRWRDMLKRAGEILEWLSHPKINLLKKPLRLLSAAAYQLAGYPALSAGLLEDEPYSDIVESQILRSLLKADFQELIALIIKYWEFRTYNSFLKDNTNENAVFSTSQWVIDEIIRSLGIICSYMRWGSRSRLNKAIEKFDSLTKIMLDANDPYSWLVAKLCAEVLKEYNKNSLRGSLGIISSNSTVIGEEAFKRYIRNSFFSGKSLAWHSQIRGIKRLEENKSFALCTPTGSGKTTIAEIAIIQNLFGNDQEVLVSSQEFQNAYPIVMYLVPSRALAAEVEAKMSHVLGNLSSQRIQVTGLYGGTDWGPSDAWVTSNEPTVLICTYEKGEALLRFLGLSFLNRLSLVVIDEAHSVQFDGQYDSLVTSDNRSLRLESLANRLISNLEDKKVIALSAVADEGNQSLSNWVSGELNSDPEVAPYRSTRQLVGRLEWLKSGDFTIKYDLLNSEDLTFSDEVTVDNVPFIQSPFGKFPIEYDLLPKKYIDKGVEKRQRLHLFWAALQISQPDSEGKQHSVLISINQHITGYAEDFVYFFENKLKNKNIPTIFAYPTDSHKKELWERCLSACEDYFGNDSYEYKLLQRGIVVHHGNMPGVLARNLIEVVNKKIVHLVLATSTLSEGVNLPFETVIIPSIVRSGKLLTISELKNLIGRAGRPGVGTEGRALIMLEGTPSDWNAKNKQKNYFQIIRQLEADNQTNLVKNEVKSPLAELFNHMIEVWGELSGPRTVKKFFDWLENTKPFNDSNNNVDNDNFIEAEKSLDTLDGILLSSIVEYEEMESERALTREQLENHLQKVWSRTYAYFVNPSAEWMEKAFRQRGGAIFEKIYSNQDNRKKIYRTSLSPRFARELIDFHSQIINHLITGNEYAIWTIEQKLNYIFATVEKITLLKKFEIPEGLGKGKNFKGWKDILEWWLIGEDAKVRPDKKEVAKWIKFIKKHFEYKFNWGLGSVISLQIEGEAGEIGLKDWPKTGLPWVVFWLKELVVWGTLDPVVAHTLSHGIDFTRKAASERAKEYYQNHEATTLADELLNASSIRKWAKPFISNKRVISAEVEDKITVNLSREFKVHKQWRVLPLRKGEVLKWIDPAGFELATSVVPDNWEDDFFRRNDFILDSENSKVHRSNYI